MFARLRKHPKKLVAIVVLCASPFVAHVAIDRWVRPAPPDIPAIPLAMHEENGVRRAGRGWSHVEGADGGADGGKGVRVVALTGTPEEIGAEHTTLLRDRMRENEGVLWDGFAKLVPFGPARTLLFDVGRFRYRHVADGFPDARRRELAAEARAFDPDPYAEHMPTYPRMVFLHALYDIALSFEHSPLLGIGPAPAAHEAPRLDGCTAFGLGPDATADGHALFARAFDFEAADVFDRDKAVFVVREEGAIPFASVAWPGLVGVVTGMNAEGVAVAVNGARAGTPKTTGIPVAFALREVLARAHDTAEATAILAGQDVMVSHIVFVGDARGHFAVVERAPNVTADVRERFADPARVGVTNHFEGPLANDPSDARVRATTTTLARRARVDELLAATPPKSATVASAVAMLRDHRCATSVEPDATKCPIGDRRTIDALIATHGVVFDLTVKALWVSEGPHLSGRFVKIDLGAIVSRSDGPVSADGPPLATEDEVIEADDILWDARYAQGRARAGGPLLGVEEPLVLPRRKTEK